MSPDVGCAAVSSFTSLCESPHITYLSKWMDFDREACIGLQAPMGERGRLLHSEVKEEAKAFGLGRGT